MNSSDLNIFGTNGDDFSEWPEYISATKAALALCLTKTELRDILNSGELETDLEDARKKARSAWEMDHYDLENFNYFNSSLMATARIDTMSFFKYAKKNGISFNINIDGKNLYYDHRTLSKLNCEDIIQEKQNEIDELTKKVSCLTAENSKLKKSAPNEGAPTDKATLAKYKRYMETIQQKGVSLVKLACEVARQGPRRGQPWTKDEVSALADELGIAIKGKCLKVFKAGMPDDLVKKSPGARPISPQEESPINVET